jgi:hypothetical protein
VTDEKPAQNVTINFWGTPRAVTNVDCSDGKCRTAHLGSVYGQDIRDGRSVPFSRYGSVSVKGKTVSGFVFNPPAEGEGRWWFRADPEGKNGHLLPRW